jgi:hypothetical protein
VSKRIHALEVRSKSSNLSQSVCDRVESHLSRCARPVRVEHCVGHGGRAFGGKDMLDYVHNVKSMGKIFVLAVVEAVSVKTYTCPSR